MLEDKTYKIKMRVATDNSGVVLTQIDNEKLLIVVENCYSYVELGKALADLTGLIDNKEADHAE